jgi:hypothetical protein
MASPHQVRCYLACWFQLGKGIVVTNQAEEQVLRPQPVIQGNRYSPEFEACWQYLNTLKTQDCYLEGTHQTVGALLKEEWDIMPCARCTMPIPLYQGNLTDLSCPCNDLPGWPNYAIPIPRPPVNVQHQFQMIHQRIYQASEREAKGEQK